MQPSKTPPSPSAFELPIEVQPEHIDFLGHVNNIVYVQWIQDVTAAHWESVSSPAIRAEVSWVVLRHEIDYKQAALPGDKLLACTWVGPAKGLSFERHVEILRANDRKLLVRARSLWCPYDASSGRPRRVTPEVRALMSSETGEASG